MILSLLRQNVSKSFMPNDNFRMLICGPSGYGKTNTLMHMIYQLLYYDKIYFEKFRTT